MPPAGGSLSCRSEKRCGKQPPSCCVSARRPKCWRRPSCATGWPNSPRPWPHATGRRRMVIRIEGISAGLVPRNIPETWLPATALGRNPPRHAPAQCERLRLLIERCCNKRSRPRATRPGSMLLPCCGRKLMRLRFDPSTAQNLHPALQRVADFVEHLGVLDGGRHAPALAVGDLLDGAAQDFSRARLRQTADGDRELEGRDGPELVANQRHDLLFDLGRRTRDPGLQH